MPKRTYSFACALLFLCATLYGSASPGSSAQNDIVSAGSGLTIGSGWYSRELLNGRPFHWVNNDATIIIHKPQSNLKKISVEVQGGPGLADPQKFELHVRNPSNVDIASVTVPGTQTLRFDLPVQAGRDTSVRLHVDGGGKKIPKDPRILNFRVFSIADASNDKALGLGHPDINSGNIRLGDNWYALEQFNGETFRWVNDDAQIIIPSNQSARRELEVSAASGPAVKSPSNWTLSVQDQQGKKLATTQVKARGKAMFSLDLRPGSNTFKLHVTSTGVKSPNDPRTLSFRVFSLNLK